MTNTMALAELAQCKLELIQLIGFISALLDQIDSDIERLTPVDPSLPQPIPAHLH